jgi:hypothetical protein
VRVSEYTIDYVSKTILWTLEHAAHIMITDPQNRVSYKGRKEHTSMTFNISELAAKGDTLDLMIAETRGYVKVTKLPARKARKSELVMSQTKGSRTNTNRRGQNYQGHATHAQMSNVVGNRSAYFKTSG